MNITIVSKEQVVGWVNQLHQKPSPALGMLLAGDRWSCVNEVVIAEIKGQLVGIATIAPHGEMNSGKPTIVVCYVLHEHRGKGTAKQLMEAAINY